MITPVLPTYARIDLQFERGEGCWLVTTDGRRFLDFTAGIAVNVLGHANPYLAAALSEQATKLWHVSNLFRIPGAEKLADRLKAATFADTMFFTNSGAEALECAIKMARKLSVMLSGQPEKLPHRHLRRRFPRAHPGDDRRGRPDPKYLEGFGPKDLPKASTRCRSVTTRPLKRRHRHRRRARS